MKKTLLLILLLPVIAFAGKEEREFMKTDVTPAFSAASSAVKTGCGCGWKMALDEATIKSVPDMTLAVNVANSIKDGVGKYCSDAASKKAICKINTVKVVKGGDSAFTVSGKTGIAMTDGQVVPNFDMMSSALDK